MEFAFPFPRRFHVRFGHLPARRSATRVLYYPGAEPSGGKDGPVLRVEPGDAEPWVGVFAGGEIPAEAAAPPQVLGWPDERSVFVTFQGSGYASSAPRIPSTGSRWPRSRYETFGSSRTARSS